MTHKKTYAAFNGKYYIWRIYGSDFDCMTSFVPSTFFCPKVVQDIIDRNGDDSFKVVEA